MTMAPARELHAHSHRPNRFAVVPTARRFEPPAGLTGRGVTIAVIDSGFYPHPDLVEPQSRIVASIDIESGGDGLSDAPTQAAWHGTQTACVAAGNGVLSDGLYRGLAPGARLVLVRVGEGGRITEAAIARGIDWVRRHRRRHGIRVVSISCGGDDPKALPESPADQAAERAVRAGICVVAAAGNAGGTERFRVVPPASAPSVVTVGGYDDRNRPGAGDLRAWRSSSGPTPEGCPKPEVLAPAAWVAAPILPGTPLAAEALALSGLHDAADYELEDVARAHAGVIGIDAQAAARDPDALRAAVERRLRELRVISAHYQHVDGTSFAAPVVASIAALLLEARPDLGPAELRRILLHTAERLPLVPERCQGFGAVSARAALARATSGLPPLRAGHFRPPRVVAGRALFHHHDGRAQRVELLASFLGWEERPVAMQRDAAGVWRAELRDIPPGRHAYKFRADGTRWHGDPSQAAEEPDGHGGTNSVLESS
jgi:serine protease AprX